MNTMQPSQLAIHIKSVAHIGEDKEEKKGFIPSQILR